MSFEDLEPPSPLALLTPDEIYESADETLLRKLVIEDRRFEKKPNSLNLRDLGDYVSMWANTSPVGGLIMIGIRNDDSFEGMSAVGESHINEIEKASGTYCPEAVWNTKRIRIRRDRDNQSDFVLLVRVHYHKTRVIRTTEGAVFSRVGDSKKRLNDEQIRQLQADKGEIRWELEPSRLRFPQDFDYSAIESFVDTIISEKHWDPNHSVQDVLQLMRLGRIENGQFLPNMACALLFALDVRSVIPGCWIRFLRFEGETEGVGAKWNAVKDESIHGTVIQQIEATAQVLRSQLRTFSKLDNKSGKFFTTTEYPEVAWYEAIVNACAHRSYSNGLGNANTFVKMFDDRLVIESPGPFPSLVTPENIYEVSIPKNPFLMEALRHLKFVKAAHEGTRRMRDTMKEHGLTEPQFTQLEIGGAFVRVTLHNSIKHRKAWVDADVATLLGARLAQALSDDQKVCLNFMAQSDGSINVTEAVRLTGKSWETCKKLLVALVHIGIVDYEHRDDIERDAKARFVLKGKGKLR